MLLVEKALNLAETAPDEAAADLAAIPEDQWFERKSGRVAPADLAKPLVAMANAEGGVILVGIEDGKVVPPQNINALRQTPIDFTRPPVRATVQEISTSQGHILVFRVPPGESVHETHKGECFQRIGDESRRLTFPQRQELEWDRGPSNYSGSPVQGADISDLDSARLAEYQEMLGSPSPERVLRARDLLTLRGNHLTVAGFLLFASRPQQLFPQAYVRVVKYRTNERGVGQQLQIEEGKDVRCEGPLPAQITEAADVISDFMPKRRALGAGGRFEATPIIPRDAWLEGLVNAVVHRSYSISGDHVRVEIFPNRIEITSPGRFPGLSDPTAPETISRNARNPRIARVCGDYGLTQELGEGIRRIFDEMRRVGLTDPIYVQTSETVRLTLMASDAIPATVSRAIGPNGQRILDAMRRAGRPLGTGAIVELTGLARPTVSRHLDTLRAAGLVTREGKSRTDPRATWHVL